MDVKSFRYNGEGKFSLKDFPTSEKVDKELKELFTQKTVENTARISELQDKFYAQGTEGLVVILQAMDAAGKDGAIKHVLSGINPQGINVVSFKSPNKTELAHDYLWRCITALPERGQIGLFNRSYYEDVLVVRVHEMWKNYKWPKRCCNMSEKDFFKQRFTQINNFEEYLYQNGYRVLKIFLNVGYEEQKNRFIARIDDENKNWKFSSGDIEERQMFPQYMEAFESMIGATGTKNAPWYVIPADQKWVARWLVSEAILSVLQDIDPQYPELSQEEKDKLIACRAQLMGLDQESEEDLKVAKQAIGKKVKKSKERKAEKDKQFKQSNQEFENQVYDSMQDTTELSSLLIKALKEAKRNNVQHL